MRGLGEQLGAGYFKLFFYFAHSFWCLACDQGSINGVVDCLFYQEEVYIMSYLASLQQEAAITYQALHISHFNHQQVIIVRVANVIISVQVSLLKTCKASAPRTANIPLAA